MESDKKNNFRKKEFRAMNIRDTAEKVESYCHLIRHSTDADIKELLRMDGDKLASFCQLLADKINRFKQSETSKGDQR